jgi:hypothetical protein
MTLVELQSFLVWCTILNSGFLLIWWGMLLLAGDFVFRVHGRWFALSRERFDAIHYQGAMTFKFLIMLFNVVPLIALYIIG